MATQNDSNSSTKVDEQQKQNSAQTESVPHVEKSNDEENSIALVEKEIDSVIQQVDPDFEKSIKDISSEEAKADLNIEMIDIDLILKQEEDQSFKARLKKLRRKCYSLILKISFYIKEKLFQFLSWIWSVAKSAKQGTVETIANVKDLSKFQKIGLLVVLLLVAGTVFYSFRAITKGWIHEGDPLFIGSLEEWATQKYYYDPQKEIEPFLDSARVTQNIFNLKRIVANIRRSESSGINPMIALELYLEGTSAESIAEVKVRESEVKDKFQRIIEEASYDQLSSVDGKQLLLEKLRREINKLISSGPIKKIYIKAIVLKP